MKNGEIKTNGQKQDHHEDAPPRQDAPETCQNQGSEGGSQQVVMAQTIFGRIIAGEIPADKLLETEDLIAIRDINPQAPVHVLVIPKKPLASLAAATPADSALLGKLLGACRLLAQNLGLEESGYRVVLNNGESAGQSVPHLHLHLLGGRDFRWPPG